MAHAVEAFCKRRRPTTDHISILVNRTPVTGDVSIQRSANKGNVIIFGCNLGYDFAVGQKNVSLTINVQIPFMPITTNGKEPDLELFVDEIRTAIERAAKKCQREKASDAISDRRAVAHDEEGPP